ncbi:MAG: hypothetical protein ABIG39_07500 [Candidatus Micrarchaeota archaeon]
MGFEEILIGVEERFEKMINFLCVIIGGIFLLFALISVLDYSGRSLTYSALAIGFFMFPLAASKVLCCCGTKPFPPPVMKLGKKK